MTVKAFPDLEQTCSALAEKIKDLSQEAIQLKKAFSLVLSGGKTPRKLYHILGTQYVEKIQWNNVHLFWGDERWVPFHHLESNYAMAFELMISKIPIPKENVHPMPVNAPIPALGAEIYETELKQHFDEIESAEKAFTFDAVILGLGEDGHTASLFPGNSALFESDKWVVSVQAPASFPIKDRLTLTFPAINISKNVFFLVSGEGKKKIVDSILNRKITERIMYPAEMVQPIGQLFWFLDQRGDS